jgi:hypothetical protein
MEKILEREGGLSVGRGQFQRIRKIGGDLPGVPIRRLERIDPVRWNQEPWRDCSFLEREPKPSEVRALGLRRDVGAQSIAGVVSLRGARLSVRFAERLHRGENRLVPQEKAQSQQAGQGEPHEERRAVIDPP